MEVDIEAGGQQGDQGEAGARGGCPDEAVCGRWSSLCTNPVSCGLRGATVINELFVCFR